VKALRIFLTLFVWWGLSMPCCLAGGVDNPGVTVESGKPEHQLLVMLHMPLPHYRPENSYAGRYAGDVSHSARRRTAEAIAGQHHLKIVSDWPMPTLGVDCFVMESPEPVGQLVEVLSRDARVESVEAMSVYHSLGNNDPLYALQPVAALWHLSDLHQVTTGKNIRVALVDSGVDVLHPDLTGQVRLTENFVDNSSYIAEAHGTAVAGIIAARAGNGIGIEGVASNAQLLGLRACWEVSASQTLCNSFTLAKALNFAILHDAQVINMSLTGPSDRLLQRLLDVAIGKGISVVGAADALRTDGGFPASHPGVLAVTELQTGISPRQGVLMAPGRDIPTTSSGGGWGFVSGASYACGHVSGLVALLLEINPAQSSEKIKKNLILLPPADGRPASVIDACASVAKIHGSCVCSCRDNYAVRSAQ